MHKRNRWIKYLIVPALLAGGIGFWYTSTSSQQAPPAEPVRTVRVVTPERMDMEETLSLRAFVEADETVTVLPLVSGTIETMNVDTGDTVSEGETIARIDPERYELAVSQAEATFSAAESTYRRTRQLYEANATTIQNLQQVEAQYEAARSQRDLARLQLSYTTVRSPIAGVVLIRRLAAGDMASPDRPLMTVGDITRLVVRAAVPEERYGRFLAQKDSMDVRITQAGAVYPGRIRSIAPYIASETRTFEVVTLVAGDASLLRPGMSVTVTFVLDRKTEVLTLPENARGYADTLWYVENGRAFSMDAPALLSDGSRLQLPEEHGERTFIVQGHHFLTDGQPVEIIEDR